MSLVEAKEILGHSQIGITTDAYTHIYDRTKHTAMDRKDKMLAAVAAKKEAAKVAVLV
jgi:hypothetical protein